jgi:hypothetical protein
MSAAINCINDLKHLTRLTQDEGLTYCQNLDLNSRDIGFNSFHHLRQSLPNFTDDHIGNISTKLMRRACAVALPAPQKPYYLFVAQPELRMRFFSHWIGWDKRGQEVRTPSHAVFKRGGELSNPVYIIETDRQLVAWRNKWHGVAYVSAEPAHEHFKEAFARKAAIVEGPRNNAYDLEVNFNCNFSTWYPVGE